ncbi:MAG: crossover junction endodeoxyribonuclease RuvC [Thermoleophilia bacterium]|nr:crossover junction endodeoxyribonuclease RuvC [Thermoleophilia bacterium]
MHHPGTPLRILGIDPGTASTGFGVVDRLGVRMSPVWYDCLVTTPKETPAARLLRISLAVREIVERMQPHAMAIEELFFGANAKTALAVGQARGVCIVACAEAGVPVYEYSPSSIKQAVTGYGRADKLQVMEMVKHQLGMSEVPRPDHAADALAVAITHGGTMHVDIVAARTSRRR